MAVVRRFAVPGLEAASRRGRRGGMVIGTPPLDLVFRTKGQLAIDISTEAVADGIRPDFYCGDEVYGSRVQLREYFEAVGQAYVLRVPSTGGLVEEYLSPSGRTGEIPGFQPQSCHCQSLS
jgi:hypothetical protein